MTSAHLLIALALLPRQVPPESIPDVRLVVSGRTGGVAAHPTRMLAPSLLAEKLPSATVRHVGFTAYERRGCYLFSDEPVELPELHARLADPARRRVSAVTEDAAQSTLDLSWDDVGGRWMTWLVAAAAATPGAHHLERVTVTRTRWETQAGTLLGVETPGCTREDAAVADPLQWEVRSVTELRLDSPDGNPARVWSVARPMGEGSRRHVAHRERMREAREQGTVALELLAGVNIEGSSYLETTTSLHRPISADALKARSPSVWVPQGDELYDGVSRFRALASHVGAVPVSANLRLADGAEPFPAYAWISAGARRLLVVGVTGTQEATRVPASVSRQIRILPPAPAVQAALKRAVNESGAWPDLVVVLGVLEGADAEAVTELPGVDVAYVRFQKSYHAEQVEAALPSTEARGSRTSPFLPALSTYRVEHTDLWFHVGNGGPARLRHVADPLTIDAPRDEDFAYRVQQVRQPIYERGAQVVLGDIAPLLEGRAADPDVVKAAGEDATHPARLGAPMFSTLTAALVQDAMGADVAITPPPREFWRTPGGFSQLRLQAALMGQDPLVVALLSGPELEKTVANARASGLGVTGMVGGQVGGRPVEPKERYLVATTEAVAVQLGLEGKIIARRFVRVGPRWIPTPAGGERVAYRSVVMNGLDALRQRYASRGEFGPSYLNALSGYLVPRGTTLTPRLMFEARDVTASFSFYDVRGQDQYSQVPDSRVRTPRNTAVLLNGMVRGALETRYLALETRLSARWDRRIFGENDIKEAFNTWNVVTEAREPFLAVNIPWVLTRVEPFLSLQYESQFLPGTSPTLGKLPPVAFGRASGGAAVFGQKVLKELRIGPVVQHDFNQTLYTEQTRWRLPGTSVGVESSALLAYELGVITVEANGAWRWLAPRPDVDTPRDLAVTMLLRTAVKARIIDGLSVSTFGDMYVFQGKMPGNTPGLSATVGVGIAADRRWKPLTELAYFW
ncbi:MAG: hypothetical protein AB2A00_24095 [Myxococcota bacterium]